MSAIRATPGLNQELFDASDVFVKWCNSVGGTNGHLIQLAKVAYLTGAVPATIINKKQYQEAGATLGWKTLYDDRYDAVGESNWLPFAQAAEPLNPPKGPRSASSLSWPSRAASASSTGTPTAAPTTATRRTSCRRPATTVSRRS